MGPGDTSDATRRRASGNSEHAVEAGRPTIVVIVLAAGGGTRFLADHHKLTTDVAGTPLVVRAVAHALDAGVGPVVVVSGAIELPLPHDLATRVRVVTNPAWAEGQATSMTAGLDAARAMRAEHALVGLGDQPGIGPDAWRAVAGAPAEWPIVVASYDGRRGPHPVRLHRSVWPLLPASGDDGARPLMREHAALVHEVPCSGSAADIDTLEDAQRWKSS